MKLISYLSALGLMFSISAIAKGTETFTSPGKPSAPIEINIKEVTRSHKIGEVAQVALSFKVPQAAENLKVSVKSKDVGKLLLQESAEYSLQKQTSTLSQELTVQANVLAEGVHYLTVEASLWLNGEKLAKVFAVPVSTSNANLKQQLQPEGKLTTTPEGRKVIIFKSNSGK
ncbi:hypothetical protein [Pleionea sp. CnH1-48]|uniref:hypothetical protein n=1 Tax=Pleionea sp. CnH1-48 TaxID=2954494 RepID=UPI002096F47F|nr:hypothetical protein [Pleionea sp. CnH1-48]MCO7225174.1 hypothetical protein [Pleionea sp. CnH1-48]